jgi:uncharacterized protein (TIGR02147 family)
MVISVTKDYRAILMEELERRCERNHRYSLRAFAKALGLTSARLSEIMNRKSGLSRDAAAKIAKRLELNKSETDMFCDLVESEHARSHAKRRFAKLKLQKYKDDQYRQLHADTFAVISDWFCFAILELTKLKEFESDPGWIAQALGISLRDATSAIERMERLQLIRVDDGIISLSGDFSANPTEVPSESIRKFHRTVLEKALAALADQPTQKRDFSTVLLAIDSRRLSEAGEMIRAFRRDFDEKMSGPSHPKDSLYCLAIQFFNLAPALEEMKS